MLDSFLRPEVKACWAVFNILSAVSGSRYEGSLGW